MRRPFGFSPSIVLPLHLSSGPYVALPKGPDGPTWKSGLDYWAHHHKGLDAGNLPTGPQQSYRLFWPLAEEDGDIKDTMAFFPGVVQDVAEKPETHQIYEAGWHHDLPFLLERLRLEVGRSCIGMTQPQALLRDCGDMRCWQAAFRGPEGAAARRLMDDLHRKVDLGLLTLNEASQMAGATLWDSSSHGALGQPRVNPTGYIQDEAHGAGVFEMERSLLEACRLARREKSKFTSQAAAGEHPRGLGAIFLNMRRRR